MGPEGGFIQKEIDSFERLGFTCVTLGPRILRLETAVPYLISRLFA
jgi:RsmE family RNA methyltransferase